MKLKQTLKKAAPKLDRIVEEPDEMKDFFLDITKYEKQSVIKKGDIFKLCKLKEKETGNFFHRSIVDDENH